MELTSLLFTFVLPLFFIITFSRYKLRPKASYPPGPTGLPVIGNMLIMDQLTHHGLAKLGKQYGGLCHLQMGVIHVVAVSTPKMAREVLQAHDSVFANRPATVAIRYLTYDQADMAFAKYGPFWRQMRKICVKKLFSRRRVESWASVREEVTSLGLAISAKVRSPVNLGELVFGLTMKITFKAAFGSASDEGQDEFMKILQEFSKLFGAFNVVDFLPWLGWIHARDFRKRLIKARASLDGFIDTIIDDHMAKKSNINSGNDDVDTNMVDELMAFYNEDGSKSNSDDSQVSIKITRDNIKALIMDVMFGGTETVASAIEWAMAELMKSPEDLKKMQQELADVVGLDRQVDQCDLEKLTYLKCITKETLRLHPPIPVVLHESSADCEVAGYRIPANSRLMINAWAIGRDETAWDEAHAFKPSRFLKSNAPDYKGSNFEFLPFGSGRRSCPGLQLAVYTMDLALAHLCHSFTWELPDGMKPSELDMNDVFGLTAPRAIQLVAVPSHRLTCSL